VADHTNVAGGMSGIERRGAVLSVALERLGNRSAAQQRGDGGRTSVRLVDLHVCAREQDKQHR
jgi:hypothetical protein